MNTEKLIEEVLKYSALYDCSKSDYRDKIMQDNCWAKVAQSVNSSVCETQKQWKCIRDQFRRCYKKKPKSGSAAGATHQWKWVKCLQWLASFTKNRCTSSNLNDSDCDENEEISGSTSEFIADDDEVQPNSSTEQPVTERADAKHNVPEPYSTSAKKAKINIVDETILKLCSTSVEDETDCCIIEKIKPS